MKNLLFTRKELYNLVWSLPISKIASKYEISELEIKSTCKKHNIPTPMVGYWSKLEFNKPVTITPLPETENEDKIIEFKHNISATGYTLKEPTPLQIQVTKIEKQLTEKLIVPQKLTNPDKLIIAAKEKLTAKDSFVNNGLVSNRYEGLDIKVSKENANRALLIMDTLIKALKACNHEIIINNTESFVRIMDKDISFALREKTKRITDTTNRWSSYSYIPTGKFIIRIDHNWRGIEFSDGKLPLEKQLSLIIASLEIAAIEEIKREIEREKRRAEDARLQAIRKDYEKRQKDDLNAFRQALNKAERWHKAVNLRNYINEVESKAISSKSLTEETQAWLIWARKKADWYDPFVEANDEFLNGIDKEDLTINRNPYN